MQGEIEGAVALHHNVCQAPFGIVEEKDDFLRRRSVQPFAKSVGVIGIGAMSKFHVAAGRSRHHAGVNRENRAPGGRAVEENNRTAHRAVGRPAVYEKRRRLSRRGIEESKWCPPNELPTAAPPSE